MLNSDNIKVIIVEDDPMVRSINESFLNKIEGTKLIGSYNSIKDAKKGIVNELPDLILLDIYFPSEQGLELLKWLRNHNYSVDVIFITADNNVSTIEEAKRYGAFDYLLKPFRFQRLQETISKYINMREQLEPGSTLNQQEVDKILVRENSMVASEFNKDELFHQVTDLAENTEKVNNQINKTYQLIYEFLSSNPTTLFTAKDIGNSLGISRITARRYLEQMVDEENVEVKPSYGHIGRPQNHYVFRGKI